MNLEANLAIVFQEKKKGDIFFIMILMNSVKATTKTGE
jgi:hypothetical protein